MWLYQMVHLVIWGTVICYEFCESASLQAENLQMEIQIEPEYLGLYFVKYDSQVLISFFYNLL